MTIERVRTTKRFSPILRHNDTIYLTGQVGEGATAAGQTRSCLDRIDALLAEVGTDKASNHLAVRHRRLRRLQ